MNVEASSPRQEKCRLCGDVAEWQFELTVLRRHRVAYYRCARCRCLETETPSWLDEAYHHYLADIDTGGAIRAQHGVATVYTVLRSLGLHKGRVLDYGGGNGLLCRMLRDIGLDAYRADRYATNDLARGFDASPEAPYDAVCSFETFEHFPSPRESVARIIAHEPKVCIVGTETYQDHGSRWWYLTPETGQHVFFYSEAGMAWLADHFGYRYMRIGNLHLFSKVPIPRLTKLALRSLLLTERRRRVVLLYLATRSTLDYAASDLEALRRKLIQ